MKKIFFCSFLLMFLVITAKAQYVPMQSYIFKGLASDTLYIPTGCGTPSYTPNSYNRAAFFYDTCNDALLKFNPSTNRWAYQGVDTITKVNDSVIRVYESYAAGSYYEIQINGNGAGGGGASSSGDTLDVTNLLSWGADNTGGTAINSAWNTMMFNSGKNIIKVGPGVYKVSCVSLSSGSQTNHKGLEFRDSVTIIIDPKANFIVENAASNTTGAGGDSKAYPVFNLLGVKHVRITGGGYINGNRSNIGFYNSDPYNNPLGYKADTSNRWSVSAMQIKDCDDIEVSGISISSPQMDGVLVMNSTNVSVRDVKTYLTGGSGFHVLRRSSNIKFERCYADSSNSDNLRVDSTVAGRIDFINCWGIRSGRTTSSNLFAGFYATASSNWHLFQCHLQGNSSYGADVDCDTSLYKNNSITFTDLAYNANAGLVLNSALSDYSHNTFLNNGKTLDGFTDASSAHYDAAAIAGNKVTGCTIQGNTFIDSGWVSTPYGFKAYGGTGAFYRSKLKNNTMHGYADLAHAENGIDATSEKDNLIQTNTGSPVLTATDTYVWTYSATNHAASWAAPSGGSGSPGGNNTDIQFNNGGVLGGSDNNTWDGTKQTIIVTGAGTSTSTPSLISKTADAATSGNQKAAPAIGLTGSQWQTTGGTSNAETFYLSMLPVQGTNSKLGNFVITNDGGTRVMSVNESGTISAGSGVSSATTSGFQGAFLAIGGNTLSTSVGFQLSKSGAASTSFNKFIDVNGSSFGTASGGGVGINISVVSAQVAETGSTYTGILGSMQTNSAINYSSSPTSMIGVKGQTYFNNAGTAVDFSLGIGTWGDILLGSAVTKNITTGYSLYATLSNQNGGSGKVGTWTGLRIDSADNSNYSIGAVGIDVRGTNGNSFIAHPLQIGYGGATGVAAFSSAILELNSTTKGFLPPVMTTTQKNAISSPAEGLIVYDMTLHKGYEWDGSSWQALW